MDQDSSINQLSLFSSDEPVAKPAPTASKPVKLAEGKRAAPRGLKKKGITLHLADLPVELKESSEQLDLKELRDLHNWSLEDLHIKTKIPIKHLAALESGSRDFLPPINVRAFLRTLGRLYEVDWQALTPPTETTNASIEFITLDEAAETNNVGEASWITSILESLHAIRVGFRKVFRRNGDLE